MGGWLSVLVGAAVTIVLLWLALVVALWVRRPGEATVRELLRLLPDLVRLLRGLAGDPAVPRGVRVRIWFVVGYLAMPIDLVPDFVPVLGWADDAVVVALVLRAAARRAGPEALERHWRVPPKVCGRCTDSPASRSRPPRLPASPLPIQLPATTHGNTRHSRVASRERWVFLKVP